MRLSLTFELCRRKKKSPPGVDGTWRAVSAARFTVGPSPIATFCRSLADGSFRRKPTRPGSFASGISREESHVFVLFTPPLSRAAMKLRTLLFWPHLAAGVLAGAVILLMSFTGVVLMYERQIIAWADRGVRSAPPAVDASRLPLGEIVQRIGREIPNVTPTAVIVSADREASVAISAAQRTLYADPHTGRLIGEGNQSIRRFMTSLRAWHRWLGVSGERRSLARAVTGWSNLLFLFIVISGAYLWFPRRWTWQRVRQVIWFNKTATSRARDFNWHNTIGVWSALPLFIVVLTALPMSFPWANNLLYRAVGEEPPAAGARGGREGGGARTRDGGAHRGEDALAGVDDLLARAQARVPGWRTINVSIPGSSSAPVAFAIDAGDGGQPQSRSTLTLDRAGNLVSFESFADQTRGRRLRSIARFAHTGEIFGLPGQTLAGVASGGAVCLVWTGVSLALRRGIAFVRRRRERADVAEESAA